MRVVFLLISILIFNKKCSSISAYLKCVDFSCNDNVSTARTLQFMNSIAGDLKELKKSIKVNIKGKNVDDNDVFWLVELDGSKGLFNSSHLKENSHDAKIELKVVANPLYVPPVKGKFDETEGIEDDTDNKLFSKVQTKNNVYFSKDETEDLDNESVAVKKITNLEKDLVKSTPNISDKKTEITTKTNDSVNILQVIENKTDFKNIEKVDELPTYKHVNNAELKDMENDSLTTNRVSEEKQQSNKEEKRDTEEESPSTKRIFVVEEKKLNENQQIVSDINLSSQKIQGKSVIANREEDLLNDQTLLTKDNVPDSDSDIKTDKNIRSPILLCILKVEKLFQPISESLIRKTGIDSCAFLVKFVNDWLYMSMDTFVIIILLLLSLLFVSYTPKIFKLTRDYKYEFKKQTQLLLELESKLRTTEEVRQKLIVQNVNFEKVIDEYKEKVRNIQEDAARKIRDMVVELDRMRNNSENRIHKLSLDLDMSIKQCKLLENAVIEKDSVIMSMEDAKKKMELGFDEERIIMRENEEDLRTKLLKVEELREELKKSSKSKNYLESELVRMSDMKNDADIKYDRLYKCFEHFKMFEELGESERREKVEECLQSRDIRQQLHEMKLEVDTMTQELKLRNKEKLDLEEKDRFLEQRTLEYEQERSEAVKAKITAETTLKVMTEYFNKKETETQKSLGHESLENIESNDQTNKYQTRIASLETENESLSRSIQKLRSELKELSTSASKYKSDANTKLADAFLQISNLDRELSREKDESRKLRCKLTNYVGPTTVASRTAVSNHTKDVSSPHSSLTEPPRFPLESLPRFPFSGRSSANSLSKKSNNS